MFVVTAARSAVMRLHIEVSPGPSVTEVLPATYRAPSRAASDVAIAYPYPLPSSNTPATRKMRIGRAMANSTRAWPRNRVLATQLQALHDHPGKVCRATGH